MELFATTLGGLALAECSTPVFCFFCDHATDALSPGARGHQSSRHAAAATAAAHQSSLQAEDIYARELRRTEDYREETLNRKRASMETARVLVV